MTDTLRDVLITKTVSAPSFLRRLLGRKKHPGASMIGPIEPSAAVPVLGTKPGACVPIRDFDLQQSETALAHQRSVCRTMISQPSESNSCLHQSSRSSPDYPDTYYALAGNEWLKLAWVEIVEICAVGFGISNEADPRSFAERDAGNHRNFMPPRSYHGL